MLCLELVETAPRMMSSTPRRKERGWDGLYDVISQSISVVGEVGLLGNILAHYCTYFSYFG